MPCEAPQCANMKRGTGKGDQEKKKKTRRQEGCIGVGKGGLGRPRERKGSLERPGEGWGGLGKKEKGREIISKGEMKKGRWEARRREGKGGEERGKREGQGNHRRLVEVREHKRRNRIILDEGEGRECQERAN